MRPPQNNCRHHLAASMLRDAGAFRLRIACALVVPEGMTFLDYARRLLQEAGLHSPDELRQRLTLPRTALLCRDMKKNAPLPSGGDPLLQACILGLCNKGFYSLERLVLWTEKRLARRVELFSVEAFYED